MKLWGPRSDFFFFRASCNYSCRADLEKPLCQQALPSATGVCVCCQCLDSPQVLKFHIRMTDYGLNVCRRKWSVLCVLNRSGGMHLLHFSTRFSHNSLVEFKLKELGFQLESRMKSTCICGSYLFFFPPLGISVLLCVCGCETWCSGNVGGEDGEGGYFRLARQREKEQWLCATTMRWLGLTSYT